MKVAIVKYDHTPEALARAIELSQGFEGLKASHRVLIKPNAAVGLRRSQPPHGVSTAVPLMRDLVQLLREYGCRHITIGEGPIIIGEFKWGPERAYEWSGMAKLAQELSVELVDFNAEAFLPVPFDNKEIRIARRALEADFFINVPVLKAHNQTRISLGLKNLKGCLHRRSKKDLHRWGLERPIALLGTKIKTDLTVIDGIYGLGKGPWGDDVHPTNLIIAGRDALACDMVGAAVMAIAPASVVHLQEFAALTGRSLDLGSVEILGERLGEVVWPIEWAWDWSQDLMTKYGVRGVTIQDPGLTCCSGCGLAVYSVLERFFRDSAGAAFDDVEICIGLETKALKRSKQVFLLGKCPIEANKGLRHVIRVKGCPPLADTAYETLMTHAHKIA